MSNNSKSFTGLSDGSASCYSNAQKCNDKEEKLENNTEEKRTISSNFNARSSLKEKYDLLDDTCTFSDFVSISHEFESMVKMLNCDTESELAIQMYNSSGETDKEHPPLKGEIDLLEDRCAVSDSVSITHELETFMSVYPDIEFELDIPMGNSSGETDKAHPPLKEETVKNETVIPASDSIGIPSNLGIQEDCFSEESDKANPPFKGENFKDKIPSNGIIVTFDSNSSRNEAGNWISCNSKVQKDNSSDVSDEAHFFMKEKTYETGREISESHFLSNKCIFGSEVRKENQTTSSEESAQTSYHEENYLQERKEPRFRGQIQAIHIENKKKELLKRKYSKIKKNYAYDKTCQYKSVDNDCLLKNPRPNCKSKSKMRKIEVDLKNSYVKSVQINYPFEKEKFLHEHEEPKLQEHSQAICTDKREHDNMTSHYSKIKTDSADATSQHNPLHDESLLEALYSVFDLICENEGTTSSSTDLQDLLISDPEIRIKSSEPYYLQYIRLEKHFLSDVEKNLQTKEKEACEFKLSLETQLKELESFSNFDKMTASMRNEFRDLQKTANDLVDSSDKLLAIIKKDEAECEWYSKSICNLLK